MPDNSLARVYRGNLSNRTRKARFDTLKGQIDPPIFQKTQNPFQIINKGGYFSSISPQFPPTRKNRHEQSKKKTKKTHQIKHPLGLCPIPPPIFRIKRKKQKKLRGAKRKKLEAVGNSKMISPNHLFPHIYEPFLHISPSGILSKFPSIRSFIFS